MVFSSPIFLFAFLPLVLICCHLAGAKLKNYVLLVFSIIFYGWGEPRFVLVMIAVCMLDYCAALVVSRRKSRALLVVAVALNLALLGWFKYAGFFMTNVNDLFSLSLTIPVIRLPIGISFFTFQAMSYVIDVYRGDCAPQRNPLWVLLYVSLFPQLIAGPIVRYRTVESEIMHRTVTPEDLGSGTERFIIGLAKKAIIANGTGAVADALFAGTPASAEGAWLGVLCYALQIYFDFSAYSDMAIGLGRMLGFHFEENFMHPYTAISITDFWRRWHISLSTWFRDYLYIPLGGNRKGFARQILNLFIVWFLTGLWHGAQWNFAAWGLFYFILLVIEKLFLGKLLSRLPAMFGRVYVWVFVLFGWVLFRADGLHAAGQYIQKMFYFHFDAVQHKQVLLLLAQYWPYILMGLVFSAPVRAFTKKRLGEGRVWRAASAAALLVLFGVTLLFVVTSTYNPFIYFRF